MEGTRLYIQDKDVCFHGNETYRTLIYAIFQKGTKLWIKLWMFSRQEICYFFDTKQ